MPKSFIEEEKAQDEIKPRVGEIYLLICGERTFVLDWQFHQ